jgi:hypothetical protein
MKCKTCGVYGHDSQGSVELCLTAVKGRMFRWKRLAGMICERLVGLKLKHAPSCDASKCQTCLEASRIHELARDMAVEDELV